MRSFRIGYDIVELFNNYFYPVLQYEVSIIAYISLGTVIKTYTSFDNVLWNNNFNLENRTSLSTSSIWNAVNRKKTGNFI